MNFKNFDKITEIVLSCASVMEDFEEAKNLLDVYLTTNYKLDKAEIMGEYEKRDSRFLGWNALEIIEVNPLDFRNSNSSQKNAIVIGHKRVKNILENNLKVKVIIEA